MQHLSKPAWLRKLRDASLSVDAFETEVDKLLLYNSLGVRLLNGLRHAGFTSLRQLEGVDVSVFLETIPNVGKTSTKALHNVCNAIGIKTLHRINTIDK